MKWYGYASASVLAIWAASPAQAANLNEILSRDSVEMICGDRTGEFEARVVLENGTVLEGEIDCEWQAPRGEEDSPDAEDESDDEEEGEEEEEDEDEEEEEEEEEDGEGEGEDEGEGEGEVD